MKPCVHPPHGRACRRQLRPCHSYNAGQRKDTRLDPAAVANAIIDALTNVLGPEGFDVMPDDQDTFVDIAADEWTLRLEGDPVAVAWISIEDEPDAVSDLSAARRAVMPAAVDRALAI